MRKAALWGVASLAVALSAGYAAAVAITVDAGGFGQAGRTTYFIGGISTSSNGVTVFDLTPGQWHSVQIQPASVGEVMIEDLGSGKYNVLTRVSGSDPSPAPGLIGSLDTSTPTLSFNNVSITINRGVNWAGAFTVNWTTARTSSNLTFTMPALPAGQKYWGWLADSPSRSAFYFNLDSAGNVTIVDSDPDGVPYTGGPNLLTIPPGREVYVEVSGKPPQANWWQLDSTGVQGSGATFANDFYAYLLPTHTAGYNFIGDLGPGSFIGSRQVTMPGPNPQVVTWQDNNGNLYTFTFWVPEPASIALFAPLAMLLRRRR
jgi:hypothetical protein